MYAEHTKDEKVSPYIILCAKDGTRFLTMAYGEVGTICYDDDLFDIIVEADESVALSKLSLQVESDPIKDSSKDDAIAALATLKTNLEV